MLPYCLVHNGEWVLSQLAKHMFLKFISFGGRLPGTIEDRSRVHGIQSVTRLFWYTITWAMPAGVVHFEEIYVF